MESRLGRGQREREEGCPTEGNYKTDERWVQEKRTTVTMSERNPLVGTDSHLSLIGGEVGPYLVTGPVSVSDTNQDPVRPLSSIRCLVVTTLTLMTLLLYEKDGLRGSPMLPSELRRLVETELSPPTDSSFG